MNFKDYLNSTIKIANEEKDILDQLHDKFQDAKIDALFIRAAERSLQILSENMIGKFKKVLQYYNCQIIPNSGYDALQILHTVGIFDEIQERKFRKILGFRNALVHDYMEFNRKIVITIVRDRDYMFLYEFLIEKSHYKEIFIRRIENFKF